MRNLLRILLSLILIVFLCAFLGYRWWQRPGPGTTSIRISGKPGDTFVGFYVQGGKRVEVRGGVPWKIEGTDISEAEFRKSRAEESLQLEARHFKVPGFDAFVGGTVKPDFAGMRIRVHHAGIGMEPLN